MWDTADEYRKTQKGGAVWEGVEGAYTMLRMSFRILLADGEVDERGACLFGTKTTSLIQYLGTPPSNSIKRCLDAWVTEMTEFSRPFYDEMHAGLHEDSTGTMIVYGPRGVTRAH
mgnify:CR=1 FL=1